SSTVNSPTPSPNSPPSTAPLWSWRTATPTCSSSTTSPPASSPTCSPPSRFATRRCPSCSVTPDPWPKNGRSDSSAPPSPTPKPNETRHDHHHRRGSQGRSPGPSRRDRSEAEALDGPDHPAPDNQHRPAPVGRDLHVPTSPAKCGSNDPISSDHAR